MLCDTRLYYMKCITFELLKLKICNFSTSSFLKKQACFETTACRWSVGSWSNCSDGCGLGFRNRQVTCAGAFWIGEPCQTSRVDWMNQTVGDTWLAEFLFILYLAQSFGLDWFQLSLYTCIQNRSSNQPTCFVGFSQEPFPKEDFPKQGGAILGNTTMGC